MTAETEVCPIHGPSTGQPGCPYCARTSTPETYDRRFEAYVTHLMGANQKWGRDGGPLPEHVEQALQELREYYYARVAAETSAPHVWRAVFECSDCKAVHRVSAEQPYFKVMEFQCLRCEALTCADREMRPSPEKAAAPREPKVGDEVVIGIPFGEGVGGFRPPNDGWTISRIDRPVYVFLKHPNGSEISLLPGQFTVKTSCSDVPETP